MKDDERTNMGKSEGTNMKSGESGNRIFNEYKRVQNAERKARKEGFAKGAWTTAIISYFLLAAAGIFGISRYNAEQKKQLSLLEDQKQSFTELLTARDSMVSEWLLTFDQIEKDLNAVKDKENIIMIQSSAGEFSKDKKQKILQDINYINTLLDQNKKKIASLTAQLKNSGGAMNILQVKAAELEASMKLRESEISDLKVALVEKYFEIEKLNTRMTDQQVAITQQQVAITQKDEKISSQTIELNKGFLVYDTYKALNEKGLVAKEGGFLGLGKTETLPEDFADSLFTRINITEVTTIPVNSKGAKFITEHPESSYELVHDKDNKIASIEIKDPGQFWKISKYAVVEIKK